MEALEEAMGGESHSEFVHIVAKRKRTKRKRLTLPVIAATSSTSSVEFSGSATEEEEDMANCLILLAQGRELNDDRKLEVLPIEEKFTSRRFTEATTTTTGGKAGFYVYECKTCNKCFPSFQALGGHRASHKKPKMAITAELMEGEKGMMDEDDLQISMNSFSKSIIVPTKINTTTTTSNGKARVHECSICGSEFSSGQALGGHMRRHRTASIPEAQEAQEVKKERSGLSLDLNLPAPSDDDHGEFPRSAFTFVNKQPLVFSASALVDCHY